MSNVKMHTWELLQKKMTWKSLDFIKNKRVLDFGCGTGITSSHFALNNEVVGIEPNKESIENRVTENEYTAISGDYNILKEFEDESFDVILCHNVFEYAKEREEITKEFGRLLKKGGILSVVKHNRYGRVMQMTVLLNNFEHANELLEGKCGHAEKYGDINYYDDNDITKWCSDFEVQSIKGIRAFWDLQQNQDIQSDETWQEKMLEIEEKVSNIDEFIAIASFHNIIYIKK